MLDLSLSLLDRIVFLVLALLGMAACFTGSRLLRFWLALAGFQTGVYLGLRFGGLLFPEKIHQLILAVLAGLLLGGLFAIFRRVGGLLAGAAVMALIADQLLLLSIPLIEPYALYIIIGLMLAGALAGVLLARFFLVLASALNGGFLAAFCLGGAIRGWILDSAADHYAQLTGGGLALVMIGTGVLFIAGAWVQFAVFKPGLVPAADKTVNPVNIPAIPAAEETSSDVSANLVLPERPQDDAEDNLSS